MFNSTNHYLIYLIVLFIFGSGFGQFYEFIVADKLRKCDRPFEYLFKTCLPIKSSYGAGLILVSLINYLLPQYDIITRTLISTFGVTFLECLQGKLANYLFGSPGWNYGTKICDGYISSYTSIMWFILIFAFNVSEPYIISTFNI